MLFCFLFYRNDACKSASFPEPAPAANACFADSFIWKNKLKLCLERTPPGKKNVFLHTVYVICGKRKRNQQNKIGGICFFIEGHMQKLSSLGKDICAVYAGTPSIIWWHWRQRQIIDLQFIGHAWPINYPKYPGGAVIHLYPTCSCLVLHDCTETGPSYTYSCTAMWTTLLSMFSLIV